MSNDPVAGGVDGDGCPRMSCCILLGDSCIAEDGVFDGVV